MTTPAVDVTQSRIEEIRGNQELMAVFNECREWSLTNFGDQKGLNHIAPCLGLVEELGELYAERECRGSLPEIHDAVGDIGIYMIDFLSRVGIDPTIVWPTTPQGTNLYSHTALLGKVIHCVLKRHQGIRGFDNDEKFYTELQYAVTLFLSRINDSYDLTKHTINTWQRVRVRNWKQNPNANV